MRGETMKLADEVIASVKGYVARSFDALSARVGALEEHWRSRPAPEKGEKGDPGPAGRNGKDIDLDAVKDHIRILFENFPKPKDGESGPKGDHGEDADEAAIAARLEAHLEKLVAALPKPKDGKDGEKGQKGEDGKSIDVAEVHRLISDLVSKAMAAIPIPKDGKDGRDGRDGKDGAGKDGEPGRDALTLDILPGIDVNRSYERGTYARHAGGLWRAIANTQAMRGWECIVNGILSIKIEQGGEREFSVRATQSDGTESIAHFTMATPLDRGVYDSSASYAKGDGVTYAGSWWIAQVDKPTAVPGNPATASEWRLAVKRGRDGKDVVRMETADRPAGVVKVK